MPHGRRDLGRLCERFLIVDCLRACRVRCWVGLVTGTVVRFNNHEGFNLRVPSSAYSHSSWYDRELRFWFPRAKTFAGIGECRMLDSWTEDCCHLNESAS